MLAQSRDAIYRSKMLDQKELRTALTFDDVLLLPAASDVLPSDVKVRTRLTTGIELNIPICSSAMDTVTEANTAIQMAREGGIGIVHKNLSIEMQSREVSQVKKAETGVVVDPITLKPNETVLDARNLMRTYRISGLPVVDDNRRLVGIITNRDLRFETNTAQPVRNLMTTKLITVKDGVSPEESKAILHKNRIEKLLVVDDEGLLKGLITIKDIEKAAQHPTAVKDKRGRLRVGAAVGVGPDQDARIDALIQAGADVIVIDTAHGHSSGVLESVRSIRKNFPNAQLIAGNVATASGTKALIDAGVNAVKVGIGPGSICTTRIVAGVGVPQLTAVADAAKAAAAYDVPIISDGGIKHSGDVAKAIAAGAECVMIGSLFAGTDESPGEVVLYQGRRYKQYRGMGSIGAMRSGSSDRYFQEGKKKLVPEGIEGRVPYRGPLHDSLFQLLGGLRASMGYVGCRDIKEMREKAGFIRISPQGLRESHVHDVIITKEAPNYAIR